MTSLSAFHPAVSQWFSETLGEPTPVQVAAWKSIREQEHTLIAAPTGSGKTLAAFLSAINDLTEQGLTGLLPQQTQILYLSPLKALSNDIERNLQLPLKGIRAVLEEQGNWMPDIKVMVRTGDTPTSERSEMLKQPPHILVSTPESLYLLLTSDGGRKLLGNVHTVIVDEIHALAGDKRGSHLTLSLERLEHLVGKPLKRIGLSATQKPIEAVAQFLTGAERTCSIVDTGHRRKMELSIELPKSPLGAVMANEVWNEQYERLEQLIQEHQTTLIFVNTRRLAERMAFNLSERLGPHKVQAHHGSMSKEQRHTAEQQLKNGELKALVATASLELGIDIGSVDLVCQMSSPKSIAAFLQRVGRSGHSVGGTPKGKLFPLTRDELVESAAMLDAIRRGELDKLIIPEQPVDILAQQIVAEVAAQEYDTEELYQLCKKAYPFRNLERSLFEEIVNMLAEGFTTRRGRRSAYLHYDQVNGRLRARKGARLTAIVSGGAIPDNFDYDVILEPEGVFVGTLNEDYAIESTVGDIFQLGNTTWKILAVETGKVRVADAQGQPPSIPFWLGEGPGRTAELSQAVSRLRKEIADRVDEQLITGLEESPDKALSVRSPWKEAPMNWLLEELGISAPAAEQLVDYIGACKAAFHTIPSQETLVLERFFDEAGDQHVVIHSPFGSRMNRAWGLSLRKRFCRKFNFELQAAATEDAIILSLGSTHSFPLQEVFQYLNPHSVREVLVQALLDAPMFEIRWRWNASRALAVLRRRAGQKVPPQLQRMASEDLIALIFPDQLACLENIVGEREVPQHPLVAQTIQDCLYEAMDIEELESLLEKIVNKKVEMLAFDLKEASPLAQEIINARPYTFLDDAPLEERRTNAIKNRRFLDPAEAKDLGRLDPEAIEKVQQEAWPQVGTADELHDALVVSAFITETEGRDANWVSFLEVLVKENRATVLQIPSGNLWLAAERLAIFQKVYPESVYIPKLNLPEKMLETQFSMEACLQELVRGRLEILGPVTAARMAEQMGLSTSTIEQALYALENEGFVFRGYYSDQTEEIEWCERRLLARIHRYTLTRLRKEIEPVSSGNFMRFLFDWHHLHPDDRPQGTDALQQALQMLEGYEAQAAAWESDLLPQRVGDYDHLWLDVLCMSGRSIWGRFSPKAYAGAGNKVASPVKTTPITLVSRSQLPLWRKLSTAESFDPVQLSHGAAKVYAFLKQRGACFFDEIVAHTGLLKVQTEEAMDELVSYGLLTSDSYSGLRALLLPAKYATNSGSSRHGKLLFTMEHAGRWSLIEQALFPNTTEQINASDVEQVIRILLKRYGVVFRRLADYESFCPPWRELLPVLRRMEARGELRGGRFVQGMWGEQFALSEAITRLREVRRKEQDESLIAISAADPLNLTGIITPGKRVPSIYSNRILYRNGAPVAVKEGKEVRFLGDYSEQEQWQLKNALISREIAPKLRAYLGKGVV